MKKVINISLIISSVVLLALLIINIFKYNDYNQDILSLKQELVSYEEKLKENNITKSDLETNLNNLKEKNKDKIWEYDRWIKWNQEIEGKLK